jgi:class 3 adenylate cyclase
MRQVNHDLRRDLDSGARSALARGTCVLPGAQARFDLDEEYLEDLKAEIIQAKRLAIDEHNTVLVWIGRSSPAVTSAPQAGRTPASYTPSHLADRILAEQVAMEARGALDGERKTITILFADIKDSMALIEGLDPEEAREIVDPTLKLMMDTVHRYEGYVAQSTGDGIFAFFGAPIAHEDHAHRALYAALLMQEACQRYAERLRRDRGLNLQIRVGLNTGEVVVRSIRKDDLHTDYTPVGHSTSLAARMESLATLGTIEDLHWLDAETQAFLAFLGESMATARILLLVNYRPECQHSWSGKTYYTQLQLDPLGQKETQELLEALLGDSPALSPLKQRILAETEGNPFFIEEIVQALAEQGILVRDGGMGFKPAPTTPPLAVVRLPPTVQSVLASRIDRLPAMEKGSCRSRR